MLEFRSSGRRGGRLHDSATAVLKPVLGSTHRRPNGRKKERIQKRPEPCGGTEDPKNVNGLRGILPGERKGRRGRPRAGTALLLHRLTLPFPASPASPPPDFLTSAPSTDRPTDRLLPGIGVFFSFFFPSLPVTRGDVEEKAARQQEQTLAQEKLGSVSPTTGRPMRAMMMMRRRGREKSCRFQRYSGEVLRVI